MSKEIRLGGVRPVELVSDDSIWLPTTVAAHDSGVVKAVPTTLHNVLITNTDVVSVWFQLFDLAAVPANGVAPRIPPVLVYPSSTIGISFSRPLHLVAGFSWASSSTATTKTITSTSALIVSAEVENV